MDGDSDDSTNTVMHDSNAQQRHDGNAQVRVSTDSLSDVCRVGVRVGPFWPEKPAIWFAQLEGQFALANITSDTTKFYYVTSQIGNQFAVEIEDIIVSPPATNKYEKLKTELIKRLSVSKEKKLKQLLMHEELGDRKPSQFLRHLQSLAGTGCPEDFVKTIWTSRLPMNIQQIIVSQKDAALETLADLADQIHDLASPAPVVASTSSSPALDEMAKQIAELTRQVQALTSAQRSRPRNRSQQRNRGRPSSAQRSTSRHRKYPLCWYHAKFGNKASKCTKPCDFKSENQLGGR